MSKSFTPSQVGDYLKTLMDRDGVLKNIAVEGEISGYTRHSSGHHYFSLKDRDGVLRCVMFKGAASTLRFQPENGLSVLAVGRISVYPQSGQYQMYCNRLSPLGTGDLHLAYEQMRERFEMEGLFDPVHKKPLPFLPKRIALLTSATGAVVHDMLRLLKARNPNVTVLIVPVAVQGQGASQEMAEAIGWVNRHDLADVMIVGRGGGSMEDLWCFNEEPVVRGIFGSRIPVISAVGHEPDYTIADFVADRRASTPSHATELVIPSFDGLKQWLRTQEEGLALGLRNHLESKRQKLLYAQSRLGDPKQVIWNKAQGLDSLEMRLVNGFRFRLEQERSKTAQLAASLHALSPLEVLGRGYAIPKNQSGAVLSSVKDVTVGEELQIALKDGTVHCRTEKIT